MINKSVRVNRVQVEWSKVLDPYSYTLLDKILYQSNLTQANNGQGFKFHIRQLAKDTCINRMVISRRFKQWTSFLTKHGETKDSEFTFSYDDCIKYMDNLMLIVTPKSQSLSLPATNNTLHCHSGAPMIVTPIDTRSKKEEVRVYKEELEVDKIPELPTKSFKESFDTFQAEQLNKYNKDTNSAGDNNIKESINISGFLMPEEIERLKQSEELVKKFGINKSPSITSLPKRLGSSYNYSEHSAFESKFNQDEFNKLFNK